MDAQVDWIGSPGWLRVQIRERAILWIDGEGADALATTAMDAVQQFPIRVASEKRRVGDALEDALVFPDSSCGIHPIRADTCAVSVAIGGGVAADVGVHRAMLLRGDPLPTGGALDDVFGRPLRSSARDKEINEEERFATAAVT